MTQDSQKQGSARISDDVIPEEAAGPRTLSEKGNRADSGGNTKELTLLS